MNWRSKEVSAHDVRPCKEVSGMMLNPGLILALLLILSATGCVQSLQTMVNTGSGHLEQGNYARGEAIYEEEVSEDAGDAESQYYLGRFKLARNKPEEALPHFEKAVQLEPKEEEYVFWKGVNHWALGQTDKERESYLKAISLNPTFIPAHVYLAHNYLDQGQAKKALNHYDNVLRWDPYHPEALYNRAVALRKLGEKRSEIVAWRKYLKYYPDGSLGREAAYQLNTRGDFSYRVHLVGARQTTLDAVKFKRGSAAVAELSKPALDTVGEIMSRDKDFLLEIATYAKGDEPLARQRAENVMKAIVKGHPGVDPSRFVLQGYGRAERIRVGGKIYTVNNSVVFKTATR